jgi:hypothetical protein
MKYVKSSLVNIFVDIRKPKYKININKEIKILNKNEKFKLKK